MIRSHVFKAISLLWLGSAFGATAAFLTQVLLAKNLGPSSLGLFSSALSTINLIVPLAGFGVSSFWLMIFGTEGWAAKRWIRGSLNFIILSSCALMALSLLWAAIGPHNNSSRSVLLILTAYIPGQVMLSLVSSKLQLEEKYTQLAVWQLLPNVMKLFAVSLFFLLLLPWAAPSNIALIYTMSSLVVFVLGLKHIRILLDGKLQLKGHTEKIIPPNVEYPVGATVASESWPFGMAGILYLIYFQSDIILINYLADSNAAGLYSAAYTVMAAVYLLPSIIYQKYLLPKMSRWATHDRESYHKVYLIGSSLMFVSGIVAMLLIWIVSPYIIIRLFGHKYAATIDILSILAICAPLRFVSTAQSSTLVTRIFVRLKTKAMGICAMLNVSLNLILIPKFGAVGAAWSTLACEAILLLAFIGVNRYWVFGKGNNKMDLI